jgi:pimeloyl-ACP methyl ester carboxylesterase
VSAAAATTGARLHDGSALPVTTRGSGPAILLPVRTTPYDAATAESMRQWGAEPDVGAVVADSLAEEHTVVTADYEGHRMAHPAPDTLTPDNLAADLLAIADAAGVGPFAYYGYSWLALAGLQLAIRTDRLWALIMGGYPPLHGPYRAMLSVTRAAHAASLAPRAAAPAAPVTPGDWEAAEVTTTADQTRQFVTLYEHLQDFDDDEAQRGLRIPRLAFAGSRDDISYGPRWGNTVVRIAEPLATNRDRLERDGWDVELLPDLDHIGARNSANSLPLIREWLGRQRP